MVVSIIGISINVIMLLIIIAIIIAGVVYNGELNVCENKQSTFCHTIQCPCDTPDGGDTVPPCFGYAKKPAGKPGQWNCSNAPLSTVDNNGNIV